MDIVDEAELARKIRGLSDRELVKLYESASPTAQTAVSEGGISIGRILVVVVLVVAFPFMGALAGLLIGEFAPGGIAALGEPGSPIRDAVAEHDAVLGAIAGLLVGILLAALAVRRRK